MKTQAQTAPVCNDCGANIIDGKVTCPRGGGPQCWVGRQPAPPSDWAGPVSGKALETQRDPARLADLLADDLNISRDGRYYIIERTHREQHGSFLLSEDTEGWILESYPDVAHRIGRRQSYAKALHDALVWIDAHLASKETS